MVFSLEVHQELLRDCASLLALRIGPTTAAQYWASAHSVGKVRPYNFIFLSIPSIFQQS